MAVRSREMDRTTGLRFEAVINRHAAVHRGRQGRPRGLRRKTSTELQGPLNDAQSPYPLAGITVVDLCQIYNGPYATFLCAQAGADVIKVEPKGGEHLRRRGVVGGAALPFAMLNANKRSVSLDLKNPQGRDLLIEMVRRADVLVENFAPGVMERLGLGVEAMHKINPRLVYAQSSGYGQEGLYRDYPAMDLTVQAMSGIMDITGFPEREPVKAGPALCDFFAGVHLYGGIVTALLDRERTGRGPHRRGRDARCGLRVALLHARHVFRHRLEGCRRAPATAMAASPSRPTMSIRPATATSRSSASASSTGRTCSMRWAAPTCATIRASPDLKTRVAHMDVVDELVSSLHQATTTSRTCSRC